jgi:hypothetical protein
LVFLDFLAGSWNFDEDGTLLASGSQGALGGFERVLESFFAERRLALIGAIRLRWIM